jgi:hypothetical protein
VKTCPDLVQAFLKKWWVDLSSRFSISFQYSTDLSSIFSLSFHYATYFTSISFHYNSEKIGKIWKKGKLKSEKMRKTWKKSKLNSENME